MHTLKPKVQNLLLTSCFSLLVTASFAFASGGEGAEPNLLKAYFWAIVNFLILVSLLVFMMKKMDIKGYFKKRTELIEQSLKEAREAKELAQKALAEVEERLKIKDREVEEILKAARESGERETGRLAEEGDKLKARILEQTKNNIDFEVKRAKEVIKEEAVEIAMELAEKKLRDKLTKEEQMKLLEESIAKIEGKN
ncbi:MAG: ATP synthase F0 subunit B [Nitrospirae bacterium]|nr:ATP synthase F0 subunit B [Nitrospirota bacterium]